MSEEVEPEEDHAEKSADNLSLYDLIKDMWVDDHEVQIYRDVMKREKKPVSYPDREDIEAMEEPLHRLVGAVVLFEDLSTVMRPGNTPRRAALSFLALAMQREAHRLYRLYHGHSF